MTWIDRAALFSPYDYAGLALLVGAWVLTGWRIENPAPGKPSVSILMSEYRRAWMVQMVTRQPRMFDVQMVAMLRQGTAFFASTSMIALGATLAMIGNADRLAGVAQDITRMDQPAIIWELKLMVLAFFLANAFLKFVWAIRLFGYSSVLMAAVPNDVDDPLAYPRARQAAEINITAGRSFNRGLRALYFTVAAATWLAGSVPLILGTLLTASVIWRREFWSQSRKILIDT